MAAIKISEQQLQTVENQCFSLTSDQQLIPFVADNNVQALSPWNHLLAPLKLAKYDLLSSPKVPGFESTILNPGTWQQAGSVPFSDKATVEKNLATQGKTRNSCVNRTAPNSVFLVQFQEYLRPKIFIAEKKENKKCIRMYLRKSQFCLFVLYYGIFLRYKNIKIA